MGWGGGDRQVELGADLVGMRDKGQDREVVRDGGRDLARTERNHAAGCMSSECRGPELGEHQGLEGTQELVR